MLFAERAEEARRHYQPPRRPAAAQLAAWEPHGSLACCALPARPQRAASERREQDGEEKTVERAERDEAIVQARLREWEWARG